MKYAKKLLALLLACVMAFGLGVSALATGEAPYIVTQSQNLTIAHGDSITLSVEVYVPTGWAVEYQWFFSSQKIQGATEPILRLSPGDPCYPQGEERYTLVTSISCEITLRNEDGTVLKLTSESSLIVETTIGWKIINFLRSILSYPLWLLMLPFTLLLYLFPMF